MGDLSYDDVPFDAYNNEQQPMVWGDYEEPFIYADDLGPGGATGPRYAQTAASSPELPGDGYWRRQLGQVTDGEPSEDFELPEIPTSCPPGTVFNISTFKCEEIDKIPGAPPGTPPGLPAIPGTPPGELPTGLVTEQACAAREQAAYNEGRTDERGNIVTTAAITAVVSGLVGVGIGYIFGR